MTRRPRTIVVAVLVALGVGAPSVTTAHEPPKVVVRELVRLQGFRRADGPAPAGRMKLRTQGAEHPLALIDRRVFALTPDGAPPPVVADYYTLQGPRALLGRFANAGPDQAVAILAERRPGGSDLFVLAVDLCATPPAEPRR